MQKKTYLQHPVANSPPKTCTKNDSMCHKHPAHSLQKEMSSNKNSTYTTQNEINQIHS